MFIHFKRHVLFFTVELVIPKRQVIDEECGQIMEYTSTDRSEILKGMSATDNKHIRFFRVYSYFILFKNNKRKHYYTILNGMHKSKEPWFKSLKYADYIFKWGFEKENTEFFPKNLYQIQYVNQERCFLPCLQTTYAKIFSR